MKGNLYLSNHSDANDDWRVQYQIINSIRSLPLHVDSTNLLALRSDKKPEDIHGEEVEFEIVEEGVHSYTEEVKRYAKLTSFLHSSLIAKHEI
jgi:hypothetical protein